MQRRHCLIANKDFLLGPESQAAYVVKCVTHYFLRSEPKLENLRVRVKRKTEDKYTAITEVLVSITGIAEVMKLIELFEGKEGDFDTLYCSRPLLNANAVIEWAKSQGFTNCVGEDDMHVTVAYSKEKIDWSEMTDSFDNVVSRKDDRMDKTERAVKAFGEKKDAIVLTFENADLHRRWKEFIDDFDASWDHDGYHPHVTITYDGLPEGLKLEDIKPYEGELFFGPEKLEPVKKNWKSNVKEVKLKSA